MARIFTGRSLHLKLCLFTLKIRTFSQNCMLPLRKGREEGNKEMENQERKKREESEVRGDLDRGRD